jgi:predicted phosphodiesterase
VLIAHLSDLHLRDKSDVVALDRQLGHIEARRADHLAITGDLFDLWHPRLLSRVLDAFAAHGFLDADRLTIVHGNHDLASGGGHPRRTADLYRLVLRFWDPPPLIAWRRRRFYAAIARRAPGVASPAPFVKTIPGGWRIAVVDTIPAPWRPLKLRDGVLTVQHGIGCVRPQQARWLAGLGGDPSPLVLLAHHFPLDPPEFRWKPHGMLRNIIHDVRVPTAIADGDRERLLDAAAEAGVRLMLCGHVHRARLAWHGEMAVGLNGQSGAQWAGRTIAYYDLDREPLEQELVGEGVKRAALQLENTQSR